MPCCRIIWCVSISGCVLRIIDNRTLVTIAFYAKGTIFNGVKLLQTVCARRSVVINNCFCVGNSCITCTNIWMFNLYISGKYSCDCALGRSSSVGFRFSGVIVVIGCHLFAILVCNNQRGCSNICNFAAVFIDCFSKNLRDGKIIRNVAVAFLGSICLRGGAGARFPLCQGVLDNIVLICNFAGEDFI